MSRAPRPSARFAPIAIGALSIGALALAGCPRFDDGDYFFLDDLEGPLCGGVPCGWTRVAGPEDGARWAESLPGEHGLHLSGNGVVVRVSPAVDLPFSVSDSQLALDLIARCDPGSTLVIEVGATEDFSGTLVGLEPTLNILSSWNEPRPNPVQLGATGASLGSIDSITIAKSGDGQCEVDWIGIFPTFF